MATWYNFTNGKHYYKGSNAGYANLNKYYVQFKYCVEDSAPTWVRCKVVFNNDVWKSGTGTDYFYLYSPDADIYLNKNKTSKTRSIMLHNGNSKVIPTETEFYLFKDCFADGFYFPAYWICCQGRQGTLGTFNKDYFNINSGSRRNFCTRVTSNLPYYDGWTPESIASRGAGNIEIINNLNNTITIKGYTNGLTRASDYRYPNYITSANLTYIINSKGTTVTLFSKQQYTSRADFEKTVSLPTNCDTCNVQATLSVTGTYDLPKNVTTSLKNIPVYSGPKELTNKPTIESFTSSTLETESNYNHRSWFKFSWEWGEGHSSHSPVTGCRVYLLIKKHNDPTIWNYCTNRPAGTGTYFDITYKDIDDNTISTESSKLMYNSSLPALRGLYPKVEIDHTNKRCQMIISGEDLKLEDGDYIKLMIEPWHSHLNKDGVRMWWVNIQNPQDTTHTSDEILIGSNGVLFYKDSDVWKRAELYIKTNTDWVPSKDVYIKDSTADVHNPWQFSE